MVLALLTIIRPLQVPPVWTVQKQAAERIGRSATPHTAHTAHTLHAVKSSK